MNLLQKTYRPSLTIATSALCIGLASSAAIAQIDIKVKSAQNVDQKTLDSIVSFFLKTVRISQSEDMQGYEFIVHPDSPNKEQIIAAVKFIWEIYDLDVKLNSLEIVEFSQTEAKVKTTQITKEVGDAEFQDNIGISIQTIRKHNDTWKMFGMPETISVKPLN